MYIYRLSNFCIFIICILIGIILNLFGEYFRRVSIKSLNFQSIVSHHDLYRKWINSLNVYSEEDIKFISTKKNISEAKYLKDNIKVFCAILCDRNTRSFDNSNIDSIYEKIGLSWVIKCTKIVFYGNCNLLISKQHIHVFLNGVESWTWAGYQKILHDINNNHNMYHWYLTVMENTFVIMENLRYYVSVLDTSENQYLGHSCSKWGLEYNCLDAGLVFNLRILRSIMNQLSLGHCVESESIMDIEFGRCLGEMGIKPRDTRDSGLHERFLILNPEKLLANNLAIDFGDTLFLPSKYRVVKGPECCSDFAISFPHSDKISQRIFDFLVYRLYPFGANTIIKVN